MSDCIIWDKYKMPKGHGQVYHKGRVRLAHRVVYERAHGPIPDGLVVRHSCDNPSCVNIEHLLLGTQADNMKDKSERGRASYNIKVDSFLEEDIKGYLKLGWSRAKIAETLGIGIATVYRHSKEK